MYNEENNVNTYACIAATRISIKLMKSTMTVDPTPTYIFPKMNVRQIKLSNTMWPAVIATNKRIVKENGFVKSPIISTNKMTGLNHPGTPGVQKICDQY